MRTGSSANAGDTWRSTLVAQVVASAEGIDDASVGILGHRVDREVAPLEVLLERDRGSAWKAKPW
jgi:hypothetical protein